MSPLSHDAARGPLDGLTVLIVEDDRDAREMLACVLETCGACVHGCASPGAALAYLAEHSPDVMVSDIAMPGEDGYSLMRRVRSLEQGTRRKLPSVALTAFARELDRQHALQAGFDRHFAKPLEPDLLVRSIAELAQSVGARPGTSA